MRQNAHEMSGNFFQDKNGHPAIPPNNLIRVSRDQFSLKKKEIIRDAL